MRLSRHFTLEEFTRSQIATRYGIDNHPGEEAHNNLHRLAFAMEKVRELLGNKPIHITSGYRSHNVNEIVGGSLMSAHTFGRACDFICPKYGSPKTIAKAIADSDIEFDQLIYEGAWVHFAIDGEDRKQVLTAVFNKGTVTYKRGIV